MDCNDEASAQLKSELDAAIRRALGSQRPILHHLNADTTWLLQLPRPALARKRSNRNFYNILIDPWFSGGQSGAASWFSQQWHAVKPAVGSLSEVQELARDIESFATIDRHGLNDDDCGMKCNLSNLSRTSEPNLIDAVVMSHEFTDHCHQETLLQLGPDVPIIATQVGTSFKAAFHTSAVLLTPHK